jgi:hypothetical protein
MLLRAQAPGDPVVRPPSPNSVSQAGLEERRNNMGPKRKPLVVPDSDSVSRAVATRVARRLDDDRFDVTISPVGRGAGSQEGLDSLATAGGYDMVIAIQANQRRDSSYSAAARLKDLTAHNSYANNGASRRITTDSIAVGADSLAANIVRRLIQMDRGPRLGAVDPEVRAFDERARDMGPPRRVVIWNHPPHENLAMQEAGSAVMDALRATLRRFPRFVPVPRDSTLDLLARSRNRETVLATLKADFMVSITGNFSSPANDSVSWQITVRDGGAATPYRERSFRSAETSLAAPFAFVAATLSRVISAMEQMDAAPRASPSR